MSARLFAQSSGKETVKIKTNIYCDHCQWCKSCGLRIYNQVMHVLGVRKVKMDDSDTPIVVNYKSQKVEVAAIEEQLILQGLMLMINVHLLSQCPI
tara:strand:- start:181 stop:468 length:288 start_codon:yes stop_codon:yes gene_type:complete